MGGRPRGSRQDPAFALWEIPEAPHVGGLSARPKEYRQRALDLFERGLG